MTMSELQKKLNTKDPAGPLQSIEIKDEKNIYLQAKGTPTFIFLEDSNEKGRITGYSYPEMFWWQVDEILEQ